MVKKERLSSDSEERNAAERSESKENSISVFYDEEEKGKCGYGRCEPNWFRCFNNVKWFLVCYSVMVIVQGKSG